MPEINQYYHPGLTLPDLLNRVTENHPGNYTGYMDKNGNLSFQTYKELGSRAKMIATGLSHLGLKKGDKIIIATQSNQETITLLWGSFFLGVVPTILQPPMTFSGYNPSVVKLMNVYEQLGNPFIFFSDIIQDTGGLPKDIVKHISDLDFEGTYHVPALKPDDLAFIQFSSGSTGDPKGIMLTHNNLMVNIDAIRIGLDINPSDVFCNWMPLFHDMGLIGYHITPVYCMINQNQVETIDFIMNPGLWLNLLNRQKGTISGCTNFGLTLVLRYLVRKKPADDWDFSNLKALLNGAEPISVRTMLEFIEILKPFGFTHESMMPVYGMAEATLAVSFAPLQKRSVVKTFNGQLLDRENKVEISDDSDPSARVLSEVGIALNDVEIRITDHDGNPLEEGIAGHIQLRGPTITGGYFNNPKATSASFCDGWLRTGDIGFFFEGRLYISGRYKDIIFKNGRNYFANDLEVMACSLDEIKIGKISFGGTTGKESGQDKVIAFVAGIQEEKSLETFRSLRALLRTNLGITVDEMVLIRSNEIPKTSSGKLQRFKLMQRYLNGDFDDKRVTD